MTEGIFAILGVLLGFFGNYFINKMNISVEKRKINIERLAPIQEDMIMNKLDHDFSSCANLDEVFRRLAKGLEVEKQLHKYAITIVPYISGSTRKIKSYGNRFYYKYKLLIEESVKTNKGLGLIMAQVFQYEDRVIHKWASLLKIINNEMR